MLYLKKKFVDYLDKPALYAISDCPLVDWRFVRSIDELDESRIDYEFIENGIDLVCDAHDKIQSIFLYNEVRNFTGAILDVPFEMRRDDVLGRIGIPCKSGAPTIDPILGPSGAWDRFDGHDHSLHIQYRAGGNGIAVITFMLPSAVPT